MKSTADKSSLAIAILPIGDFEEYLFFILKDIFLLVTLFFPSMPPGLIQFILIPFNIVIAPSSQNE